MIDRLTWTLNNSREQSPTGTADATTSNYATTETSSSSPANAPATIQWRCSSGNAKWDEPDAVQRHAGGRTYVTACQY